MRLSLATLDRLPAGSIKRRLAFALLKRLGEWITTEDLMDVAYDYESGSKETLKAHIHNLREVLLDYVIDGDQRRGRRMRRI